MTTSSTQPNDADLELLSSYIDQQLDAADRASLEARLERDPLLRQMLDELRGTVTLLRELPPARPPRSFTLDPAMAPAPRRGFPWVFGLRLGATFAAVLLALTVTLDLMGGGAGGSSAPSASAPMSADMAAPTVAAASADMERQGLTPTPAAPVAPAAEMAAQPTEEAQPEAAQALEPTPEPLMDTQSAAAPTAEGEMTAASGPAEATGGADPGALGANTGITSSGSSSPDTGNFEAQTSEQPTEVASPVPPLRIVQLALGGLTLLLALASVWLARRAR